MFVKRLGSKVLFSNNSVFTVVKVVLKSKKVTENEIFYTEWRFIKPYAWFSVYIDNPFDNFISLYLVLVRKLSYLTMLIVKTLCCSVQFVTEMRYIVYWMALHETLRIIYSIYIQSFWYLYIFISRLGSEVIILDNALSENVVLFCTICNGNAIYCILNGASWNLVAYLVYI